MELAEKVANVLARSSARVKEREALWSELLASFEANGAPAATESLANRANALKLKFEKTLADLVKNL
jgi:hypothetical protein